MSHALWVSGRVHTQQLPSTAGGREGGLPKKAQLKRSRTMEKAAQHQASQAVSPGIAGVVVHGVELSRGAPPM